ncbi:unnamed protein product [Clonostachys rosea]|uniref:Uncharacterized protein n=1 Tax=Bionectria ochroleuca TaxID=29856 RepID=A0ABY6U9D5_BIOOC|nr:unnamed protein product [Clonostachys rosea]
MRSLRKALRELLFIQNTDNYMMDTPEFYARRKEWQETCTQYQVLTNFTTFLLNGTPRQYRAFKPWQIDNLKKAYADHTNLSNSWDQKSLESYLLTQLPQGKDFEAPLILCMPSIWALTVYFSEWPFNTTCSAPTSLTFPALVRAVAFLCGRHTRPFLVWTNDDSNFNLRTDKPVLEYIFRVLAIARPTEQQTRTPVEGGARQSSQRDVLNILNAAQPMVNNSTIMISRDLLIPTADRLSPPTPPELSDLFIQHPNVALIPLLELSRLLFRQVAKFEYIDYATSPERMTLSAIEKLRQMKEVSFDDFANLLEVNNSGQSYIYSGIALLFNTFPKPQSLITGKIAGWSEKEQVLSIFSLSYL